MAANVEALARVSWLEILLGRRSRRFGLGMRIPAGPLAYASRHAPCPLTEDEEAALAFAAAGITGPALGDLCYAPGHGGNILNGFVGRTVASGDSIQAVALFVINDEGSWLIKRPRDFTPAELGELIRLAKDHALTEVYRRGRVRVKAGRSAPPREPLFNLSINQWSAYAPGTTYFLPVNDLSFLYINGLLEVLNETTGAFVLDERAGFRPAGLADFARSRGGHLHDDVREGRLATIELVERLVTEFVTIEQGMMLQNLGLMAEALGLGGFPNFANHEFGWFQALGFGMGKLPASRYLGAGCLVSMGMKLLGRDVAVPYPIGLEVDGQTWMKAYCPPHYPSMTAAVNAVVEAKTAAFEQAGRQGAWTRGAPSPGAATSISRTAVAATTAYCEYIWRRYGRFPAYLAPFRTVVGFQACHLDAEFYDQFYQTQAITPSQRQDFARATRAQPKPGG